MNYMTSVPSEWNGVSVLGYRSLLGKGFIDVFNFFLPVTFILTVESQIIYAGHFLFPFFLTLKRFDLLKFVVDQFKFIMFIIVFSLFPIHSEID